MILAREPAARIAAVASSFPSNTVGTADAVRTLRTLFPEQDAELVKNLVERSGVETRRIVPTLEEVLGPSTFTARNDRYRVAATELAVRAARLALDQASITPRACELRAIERSRVIPSRPSSWSTITLWCPGPRSA